MGVRDDIRDGVRLAVQEIATSSTGAEAWEYRRMTSNPGVSPRTYGSWTAFSARRATAMRSQEYQGNGNSYTQFDDLVLTIYAELDLLLGDQVRDSAIPNAGWAFDSQTNRGIGIQTMLFKRETPLVATADRGGKV